MNLLRSIPLYPFAAYGPPYIPIGGTTLVDDTGDVFYGTLYMRDHDPNRPSLIFKYVYSTDTLTQLAMVEADSPSQLHLCWTANKAAFIAFRADGGDTTFWNVSLAGVVTSSGVLTGHSIEIMKPDPVLGYVGKRSLEKAFYQVDPAAGTATLLTAIVRYSYPFEIDADYIYGVQADDQPGPGGLTRFSRARGYLAEFLCGSIAGTAPLLSSNPAFASFKSQIGSVMKAGNYLYFSHSTSYGNDDCVLLRYNLTTGVVDTIVDLATFNYKLGGAPFVVTNDGSKVATGQASQDLKIFG